MTSVTASQIPTEQQAFTDTWNLLKNYYDIGLHDSENWSKLVNTARDITDKAADTDAKRYVLDIVLATLDYLERRAKAKENDGTRENNNI